MRILERLRGRSARRDAGGPTRASSADEQRLPIARYEQLNRKRLIPQLSLLSQVELAAVEAHERSHLKRIYVLNRLRWLRGSEPLAGYDTLDPDEIVRALADADKATVQAVRTYERHHRDRPEVLLEATRVLSTARADTPATHRKTRHSPLERAAATVGERNERERLRDEARYRRERLDLYRARLYSGRATSQSKLRELQRASDGAAARLERAEAAFAPPT